MPMITEANDNINKAFPWVFLLISMFDPYGHLRFISSSTCNRESKPDMRKAAKQPVFSPMVPHTRRLDLVKQNKQNCSAPWQICWAAIPQESFQMQYLPLRKCLSLLTSTPSYRPLPFQCISPRTLSAPAVSH